MTCIFIRKASVIRKSILRFLTIAVFGIWLFAPALAQQDVYLKVQSGMFQPVAILVMPFDGSPAFNSAKELEQVIINDLNLSGFFQVLNDGHTMTLQETSVMLEGKIEPKGSAMILSVRLLELPSEKLIMQKQFAISKQNYRSVAHQVADEVVRVLIGVPGIAQTQIAYVSKKSGNKELYVMDYDGHGSRQLTNSGSINLSPRWSPKGDNILFTSYISGNPDLYMLSPADAKLSKLSYFDGLNTSPDWSPDGKKIALTLSKDGNPEIYVMDVKERKPRRLTHSPGIDTSPSWSPTGKEIAFNSDRSGSPQIYIMDVDGANVRRLTYEGNYNVSPAWSPRGDHIAYVSREDNSFNINVIDINGENTVRLNEGKGRFEDPVWSPNGFHIAFSSNMDGNSNIYLMRWDGSNIRRLTKDGENYSPSWSSAGFRR